MIVTHGSEISTSAYYSSPRLSSEVPDCSLPCTFDHLSACQMACSYCFSFFQKSNNPAIKNKDLKAVNVNRMIKELDGTIDSLFYRHFYKRKFVLHWGGLADPFCGFELQHLVGLPLVERLGELNYPTLFSTKGPALVHPNYLKVWDKFVNQKNFAFQVSIITADDDLARQVEVDVPPPSFRLKMLKEMSDRGYWTVLRLRPFIIGITDPTLDELLDKALKAGINAISTEFFAIDSRCNVGMKTRYENLARMMGIDNLQKYFSALSPSERGGYMRLNRHIKEPFIKKMYKFCQDNNLVFACSDPDFKELNTSGSCCGLTIIIQPIPFWKTGLKIR
jgi:DNA repair photolyase